MTKVRSVQQDVDSYLKHWDNEALTISVDNGSSSTRFNARLAQYEFQSMDALKAKITQFPSQTKFVLSIQPRESATDDRQLSELRAFLTARGMLVVEQKNSP